MDKYKWVWIFAASLVLISLSHGHSRKRDAVNSSSQGRTKSWFLSPQSGVTQSSRVKAFKQTILPSIQSENESSTENSHWWDGLKAFNRRASLLPLNETSEASTEGSRNHSLSNAARIYKIAFASIAAKTNKTVQPYVLPDLERFILHDSIIDDGHLSQHAEPQPSAQRNDTDTGSQEDPSSEAPEENSSEEVAEVPTTEHRRPASVVEYVTSGVQYVVPSVDYVRPAVEYVDPPSPAELRYVAPEPPANRYTMSRIRYVEPEVVYLKGEEERSGRGVWTYGREKDTKTVRTDGPVNPDIERENAVDVTVQDEVTVPSEKRTELPRIPKISHGTQDSFDAGGLEDPTESGNEEEYGFRNSVRDKTLIIRRNSTLHYLRFNEHKAIPKATHRPLLIRHVPGVTTALENSTMTTKFPDNFSALTEDSIPGIPDQDYPVLNYIPNTDFRCGGRYQFGYYADVDAKCQVFHMCHGIYQDSFLCPIGTMFNQQYLVCDWWYNVHCPDAPKFYSLQNLTSFGDDVGLQDVVGILSSINEKLPSDDELNVRKRNEKASSVPPPTYERVHKVWNNTPLQPMRSFDKNLVGYKVARVTVRKHTVTNPRARTQSPPATSPVNSASANSVNAISTYSSTEPVDLTPRPILRQQEDVQLATPVAGFGREYYDIGLPVIVRDPVYEKVKYAGGSKPYMLAQAAGSAQKKPVSLTRQADAGDYRYKLPQVSDMESLLSKPEQTTELLRVHGLDTSSTPISASNGKTYDKDGIATSYSLAANDRAVNEWWIGSENVQSEAKEEMTQKNPDTFASDNFSNWRSPSGNVQVYGSRRVQDKARGSVQNLRNPKDSTRGGYTYLNNTFLVLESIMRPHGKGTSSASDDSSSSWVPLDEVKKVPSGFGSRKAQPKSPGDSHQISRQEFAAVNPSTNHNGSKETPHERKNQFTTPYPQKKANSEQSFVAVTSEPTTGNSLEDSRTTKQPSRYVSTAISRNKSVQPHVYEVEPYLTLPFSTELPVTLPTKLQRSDLPQRKRLADRPRAIDHQNGAVRSSGTKQTQREIGIVLHSSKSRNETGRSDTSVEPINSAEVSKTRKSQRRNNETAHSTKSPRNKTEYAFKKRARTDDSSSSNWNQNPKDTARGTAALGQPKYGERLKSARKYVSSRHSEHSTTTVNSTRARTDSKHPQKELRTYTKVFTTTVRTPAAKSTVSSAARPRPQPTKSLRGQRNKKVKQKYTVTTVEKLKNATSEGGTTVFDSSTSETQSKVHVARARTTKPPRTIVRASTTKSPRHEASSTIPETTKPSPPEVLTPSPNDTEILETDARTSPVLTTPSQTLTVIPTLNVTKDLMPKSRTSTAQTTKLPKSAMTAVETGRVRKQRGRNKKIRKSETSEEQTNKTKNNIEVRLGNTVTISSSSGKSSVKNVTGLYGQMLKQDVRSLADNANLLNGVSVDGINQTTEPKMDLFGNVSTIKQPFSKSFSVSVRVESRVVSPSELVTMQTTSEKTNLASRNESSSSQTNDIDVSSSNSVVTKITNSSRISLQSSSLNSHSMESVNSKGRNGSSLDESKSRIQEKVTAVRETKHVLKGDSVTSGNISVAKGYVGNSVIYIPGDAKGNNEGTNPKKSVTSIP